MKHPEMAKEQKEKKLEGEKKLAEKKNMKKKFWLKVAKKIARAAQKSCFWEGGVCAMFRQLDGHTLQHET